MYCRAHLQMFHVLIQEHQLILGAILHELKFYRPSSTMAHKHLVPPKLCVLFNLNLPLMTWEIARRTHLFLFPETVLIQRNSQVDAITETHIAPRSHAHSSRGETLLIKLKSCD